MQWIQGNKAQKKAYLEEFLNLGTAMIFVDSRREDVLVPLQHKGNIQLLLNLDYAFQIPDFVILEDKIQVSLSFNQKDFFCVIPFDAVYIMKSQSEEKIYLFQEDIPPGLAFQPETGLVVSDKVQEKDSGPFQVISNKKPLDEEESPIKAEVPKIKRDRSHLRVIK